MTEEHTNLKVDSSVVQDGHGYKDVDTYVKMPDGSEWLFRTYREYETGAEVKCEPRDGRCTPLVCPKCGHPVWEQA